jgi:putative SOS response-associated peptidase YedK
MCGRYTLTTPAPKLAEHFQLDTVPNLTPRYNIAPTQLVAIVRAVPPGKRELTLARWGLVPSWAADVKIGNRLLNARAETVADKPAFRNAFRGRRCLIPADGFYEWQPLAGRKKQPYHIRLKDAEPFALAGLWERWTSPDGSPLESCTILTTEANDLARPIHDRMPVILPPEAYDLWLDLGMRDVHLLQTCMRPYLAEAMVAVPVGPGVGNARFDDPQCLTPLAG